MKTQCYACGQDCSHAYATHNGYPHHIACIPATPRKSRERFCWYCGDSLGVVEGRHYEHTDTCGKRECERAAGDAARAERDEAHEQLDRDRGWL